MEDLFGSFYVVLRRLKDRPKYIRCFSPSCLDEVVLDPLSMVDRPDLPVVADAQKVDDNRVPSVVSRRDRDREKRGKKGREKPRNGEKVSSSRAANDRRKHRCRFLFPPCQKPVLPPVQAMKTSPPPSIPRRLTTATCSFLLFYPYPLSLRLSWLVRFAAQ